jgi:hypothetical protein
MDGAVIIIDPMIRGLRLIFRSWRSEAGFGVIIIDPMIRGLRPSIPFWLYEPYILVIIIDPMIRGLRRNSGILPSPSSHT